jgi:hypothetical protein
VPPANSPAPGQMTRRSGLYAASNERLRHSDAAQKPPRLAVFADEALVHPPTLWRSASARTMMLIDMRADAAGCAGRVPA